MDISVPTDPTSLTPHKDAAAKAIEQLKAYYEPRFSLPGYEGVHARVNLAIMTAYLETFAQEKECGSTAHQIGEAFAEALGGAVASFGASLAMMEGQPENLPHAVRFMLQRVAQAAMSVGASEYIGVDYGTPETGNA